jgi:hypothetical protein
MRLRSSLLSVGWPMLASMRGTISVMRSAVGHGVKLDLWMQGRSVWQSDGPGSVHKIVRHLRDEAREVLLELSRLVVPHFLESEYPASALLPREGQSVQQLGPRLCVWVLQRRGDVRLCGVQVVQLRGDAVKFCPLIANADQRFGPRFRRTTWLAAWPRMAEAVWPL